MIRVKHHIIALAGYMLAFVAGIIYVAIERANGEIIEISNLYEFLGFLIGTYLAGIFITSNIHKSGELSQRSSKKVIFSYLVASYSIFIAFMLVILFRVVQAT